MSEIKFGTDGWRAIVGEDFNEENVAKVSRAIAKYVYDEYGIGKKIIIGYDPRNMADVFSKQCADIISSYGFEVYYSERVIPTPVLAYCAKDRNACAVMFTASHNPPEYLGIKFIPDYAGPATQEITDKLVENLDKEFETNLSKKEIIIENFEEEYFTHIEKLIDFDSIKELDTTIIFDGLYAASIGYFDKLLDRHGIKYETLHMHHDVNFGGGMPEPKPKFLKELIEKVKENGNAIGLANDGDSDRFGVINEKGEYVTPNEIISILLLHLVGEKDMEGCLVKTVGASLLLNKVADLLNVPVVETAVGFKHVGQAMRNNDCIIGGEESGGLSIKGHIPEKDGLLANLLVLEAMAYSGKSLVDLQKEIKSLAGCSFVNDRIDLKLDNRDKIKDVLDIVSSQTEVAGMKVNDKNLIDGVKIYVGDSSWILARPSGTEPLLRIYFESDTQDNLKKLQDDIMSKVDV